VSLRALGFSPGDLVAVRDWGWGEKEDAARLRDTRHSRRR